MKKYIFLFSFDEAHSHLIHRLHGYCLTLQPHSKQLGLAPCDANNTYQQWTIMHKKPNWWAKLSVVIVLLYT